LGFWATENSRIANVKPAIGRQVVRFHLARPLLPPGGVSSKDLKMVGKIKAYAYQYIARTSRRAAKTS
jgi:hypothetical protein